MVNKVLVGLVLAAMLSGLASCAVTRRVPEGDYMLMRNRIKPDRETPRSERISAEDFETFIRQPANRRFLGTNMYVQLYSLANPESDSWGNRTLRSLGEAPVVFDSTLMYGSGEGMKTYMNNHGFFESDVAYRVDSAYKRTTVTYSIHQGPYYRIGDVNYEFRDENLRQIVYEDTLNRLVNRGDILDLTVLDGERTRLMNYLKNNGYYQFSARDNVRYVVDTMAGNRTADVTMVVSQYIADYTSRGEPVYENNSIFRIREIYVDPDYDPTTARSGPAVEMDTIEYRGLRFLTPRGMKPKVRNEILRQAINISENTMYNAADVQQTYNDIMRLGYYKNASILFEEIPDAEASSEVTYIGGDGPGTTTTERYLICRINCIPAMRQSYTVDLEGTQSPNYYALTTTLGYQNRNLFRGVEQFEVNLRGGYEFMRTKGKKSSFELGGSVAMSFPRFIAPFRIDRYNMSVNPRTRFELSVNTQRRPMYHRTVTGANWGYTWSNRRRSTYSLRPVDVNVVDLSYIDQSFFDGLNNPYLKNSFESQLIAGISGSYAWNTQVSASDINSDSKYFRLNWETAGNLIGILSDVFNADKYEEDGKEYYKIFGKRYAQYFRLDASYSQRIALGPKTQIAYRVYAGAASHYGNGKAVPYDRLFYSGGSSSMRGWTPRSLGPGGYSPSQDSSEETSRYESQLRLGNMKLEANLELRFPVWDALRGALFFDVGNVWYIDKGDYPEAAVFDGSKFYKQLGFNTGLGARFDFGFAVVRLDWGLRLHDPNPDVGWIKKFRVSDSVLNFGVGYPF